MNKPSPQARLLELIVQTHLEAPSPNDVADLQTLLQDTALRRLYIELICLEDHLESLHVKRDQDTSAQENDLGPLVFALHPNTAEGLARDDSRLTLNKTASALAYVLQHTFTPKRLAIGAVSAAAALILLALILFVPFGGQPEQPELATPPTPPQEPDRQQEALPFAAPVVAQVHSTINARWIGLAPGETRLRSQTPLTLSEGLAELELSDGARVIVQAPAVFELTGTNAMRLTSGRLVAHVPPAASGFEVVTRTARIVDIGTEFGVLAKPNGGMHTHVFKGSIVLTQNTRGTDTRATALLAGEAIALDERGTVTATTVEALAFVRPDTYTTLRDEPMARWENSLALLTARQDLVAHYPFTRSVDDASILLDASQRDGYAGTIQGATWAPGRFPGKDALFFDGNKTKQFVLLGEAVSAKADMSESFSIAIWLRSRTHLNGDSSLIQRDEKDKEWPWTLMVHGREGQPNSAFSPRLAIHTPLEQPREFGAVPFVGGTTPLTDDRWHHAVLTYQRVDDHAIGRMYIDGVLEQEKRLPRIEDSAARLMLGNRKARFDGWIDEVGIFSSVLSAEEISAMHAAGDPSINPDQER